MWVQDAGGRIIYTATVSVAPSTGHLVKLYRPDVKDFVGFIAAKGDAVAPILI
jgi:hypothetical protein